MHILLNADNLLYVRALTFVQMGHFENEIIPELLIIHMYAHILVSVFKVAQAKKVCKQQCPPK